ncbi:unnamed protein product [Penicillium olsonii]|nr:unnamed protein product [Penicillium olsonii]CAG7922228.1 unnamed protein product [Penicillium olsonii]
MAPQNPIIPGFAPDPSIVRIRDTFYLVNSSFHLFPGLPIFASKDLIAWRHIGNAINRPAQLSLSRSGTRLSPVTSDWGEKSPATGGLYAPTIRHHKGVIYIVCTNVIYQPDKDQGDWVSGLEFENFIISTPDISLDVWSDPIYFDFYGIDPDLFFDENDRAYISGSSWMPSPSCSISCFEIDLQAGRKKTNERVLWHGYMQVIPEGPHLFKRDGYYYLLIAEGGTHDGHCVSIARASNIWGPYESCPQNPILPPTAGLSPPPYCHYNGHADLVQGVKGDWWSVCLGVRRDRAGRMVRGRETFLAAVDWQSGQTWPQIQQPIPQDILRINLYHREELEESKCLLSSNQIEPVLSTSSPTTDLVWIRDPDLSRYQWSQDIKSISILPLPTEMGQCTGKPTAFAGRRIRRSEGSATADLLGSSAHKDSQDLKIGLAYYKDEYRFSRIFYELSNQAIVFDAVNHSKSPPILMESRIKVGEQRDTRIQFRIRYTDQLIQFLFRMVDGDNESEWQSHGLVDTLDMTGKDFTGPVIGVFAIGKGEDWWTFENVDI